MEFKRGDEAEQNKLTQGLGNEVLGNCKPSGDASASQRVQRKANPTNNTTIIRCVMETMAASGKLKASKFRLTGLSVFAAKSK